MIISIDLSITELEKIPNSVRENLFIKIAESSAEGIHLFLIPLEKAKWVIDNVSLSESHIRQTMQIGRNSSYFSRIKKDATTMLSVKFEGNLKESADKKVWSLGYLEFLEGNYLSKPAIIVENIRNDRGLYDLILKKSAVSMVRKYRNLIELKYTFLHGGGSTSPDLVEYLFEEDNKIIVCICDTDKLSPYGMLSKTLKRTLKVTNGNRETFIGYVTGTPGRALENFLSLELISEISGANDKVVIDRLIKLRDNQKDCKAGDCLWLYFDVKGGINSSKVLFNCETEDKDKCKDWIIKKYNMSERDFENFELNGFGRKTVWNFLKSDKSERDKIFADHMESDYWKLHFSDWVESILWYFCGRKKERV